MNSFFEIVRSNRIAKVSFALIIPALFLVLGIAAGIGATRLLSYLETHSLWYSVPPPPSEAIGFIGAGSGCAYVDALDGHLYFYCEQYLGEEGMWERLDEPPRIIASPCSEDDIPEPPRKTIEVVEYCSGTESLDNTGFALLEDGTMKIYRISTTSLAGQIGRAIGAIILGALAGFVIGITLVVVVLTE